MNEFQLLKLVSLPNKSGPCHQYHAVDTAKKDKDRTKLDDLLCPRVLKVNMGAQVMVIKNLRGKNLFNGSVGKVKQMSVNSVICEFYGRTVELGFENFEIFNEHKKLVATRSQIPLLLAYAM